MKITGLSQKAFELSRFHKRRIAMVIDASLCALTVPIALFLRLGDFPAPSPTTWAIVLVSIGVALPVFGMVGIYRHIFSQSGLRSIAQIGGATLIYGTVFAAIFTANGFVGIPRTVGIIQPILLFLLVSLSRVCARQLAHRELSPHPRPFAARAIIYGAGAAGRQMAAALQASREMSVVAFLDDNAHLHRSVINGVPIYDPADVAAIAKRLRATDVLLAAPSASRSRRNEMIEAIRAAKLRVRTIPGITDLASGRVEVSDIRELEFDELLGRSPVDPHLELLEAKIRGKTVLITGAGGSIGSELSRQVLACHPTRLLLLELSEFALYDIHRELLGRREVAGIPEVEILPLLGSVVDEARMRAILLTWQPDTIYHAAAYKHVPLVEHNPIEGVRNNVLGTYYSARLAGELGVSDFVLVSTDKAVRPTNVMGASKRAAELALQALNEHFPKTCFCMVRFGNVLGSSGSVVPLFRRQISAGGPVTVTDLRITRFFMSIPEAAQLVIQAGAMASGGDVFVLNMGEPVKIADLARRMIELSGRSVRDAERLDGDIEILEIGLRPGEKLYEELLIGANPEETLHPRILKADEAYYDLVFIRRVLDALHRQIELGNAVGVIHVLKELVTEFSPTSDIVDWVFCEAQSARTPLLAVPLSDARADVRVVASAAEDS